MSLVPEFLGKEPIQPVIRVGQGSGDLEAGATKAVGADGHQERFGRNPSAGKILKTPSDQFLAGQENGRFHPRILYDNGGNNQTHLVDLRLTCQNKATFRIFRTSKCTMQSGFSVFAPSPQISKPWVVGSIPTSLTTTPGLQFPD